MVWTDPVTMFAGLRNSKSLEDNLESTQKYSCASNSTPLVLYFSRFASFLEADAMRPTVPSQENSGWLKIERRVGVLLRAYARHAAEFTLNEPSIYSIECLALLNMK
jgi:hypothetical protein